MKAILAILLITLSGCATCRNYPDVCVIRAVMVGTIVVGAVAGKVVYTEIKK